MSTVRAMDRAAKQAERQRLARQLALLRQTQLDEAAQAATEYETIVESLTGAHRVEFRRRDWSTDASAEIAKMPPRPDYHERAARAQAAEYRPGLFSRMFGREAAGKLKLADEIVAARRRDDDAHSTAIIAVNDRNAEIEAARRIVAREPQALVRVLEEHSSIGSLPFSVEGAQVRFIDDRVVAIIDGLDIEDIPQESVSLLRSGKMSVKGLASGARHEMHRDCICSAAVRVAAEFLSVLPLDVVEVIMLTDILDRGSGHIRAAPVLHVRVSAQALSSFNLTRADATPLIERLGGHMDWSKRDGFRMIDTSLFDIELVQTTQ